MSLSTLQKLCQVLGVSSDFILMGIDDDSVHKNNFMLLMDSVDPKYHPLLESNLRCTIDAINETKKMKVIHLNRNSFLLSASFFVSGLFSWISTGFPQNTIVEPRLNSSNRLSSYLPQKSLCSFHLLFFDIQHLSIGFTQICFFKSYSAEILQKKTAS